MSSSAGCAAASPSLRRAHAPPINGRGARSGSILSPSTRRRRAVVVAAKDGDNGWMKGLEGIGGILKRMPGVTIYQVRPRVLPHTRPHPRHAHPARRTPSRNKDPHASPHSPAPSIPLHPYNPRVGRRASARVTRHSPASIHPTPSIKPTSRPPRLRPCYPAPRSTSSRPCSSGTWATPRPRTW